MEQEQKKNIKLDWQKVDTIRNLHKTSVFTYGDLGKMFGVCRDTIKSIVQGKTWPEEKRPKWGTFNDFQ